MLIIRWCEIKEKEWIPPFGDDLKNHLEEKGKASFHASCSAWTLLYQTLIENGCPIKEVAFEEKGKPYFKEGNIHISLSHSHEICAVAISDKPVGVDVEIVKETYNPRMIERSLCYNEKVVYDGDFTRIWSRKEAVAKMTGNGIAGYPVNIDTTRYQYYEEKIPFDDYCYWVVCVVMSRDAKHEKVVSN